MAVESRETVHKSADHRLKHPKLQPHQHTPLTTTADVCAHIVQAEHMAGFCWSWNHAMLYSTVYNIADAEIYDVMTHLTIQTER